jgi:hypothetical protein
MKSTKIWETTTTGSGKHVELFLSHEYYGWTVTAKVNGKREANGTPRVLDARTKKSRKIPAEAYVILDTMLFGEPAGRAVMDAYEAGVKAGEVAQTEQAATINPIGFRWVDGCDTASTYRVLFADDDIDGSVRELVEKRLKTFLIEKRLTDADFREIAKATGAEPIPSNLGSYGGCLFNAEGFRQLLLVATERQAVIDAKTTAAEIARGVDVAAKIQQAKDTGKPVQIERWSEECDSQADIECDLDIVTRTAMPDGTIRLSRSHTH